MCLIFFSDHKPNCEAPGSACYDPCFIGGDGIVFYFHGKSNEQFSLVYDFDLQINSRFIGHRPAGRPRDFTWIQALGILYNSQTFSLEATKAATWDSEVDHLKLTYNGQDLVIPEGSFSTWYSPEKDLKVERVSSKNSAIITFEDRANILVNVVPVTEEDDKIHKYQVPANDCFVHLEVNLSSFTYPRQLIEYLAGLTGLILRTPQSLVSQCQFWEVKTSTEPHPFSLLIAPPAYSLQKVVQTKRPPLSCSMAL
jgi:hypothetical protein